MPTVGSAIETKGWQSIKAGPLDVRLYAPLGLMYWVGSSAPVDGDYSMHVRPRKTKTVMISAGESLFVFGPTSYSFTDAPSTTGGGTPTSNAGINQLSARVASLENVTTTHIQIECVFGGHLAHGGGLDVNDLVVETEVDLSVSAITHIEIDFRDTSAVASPWSTSKIRLRDVRSPNDHHYAWNYDNSYIDVFIQDYTTGRIFIKDNGGREAIYSEFRAIGTVTIDAVIV